jgi:Undecaprenyl-phosphate glucose phosphotransferase
LITVKTQVLPSRYSRYIQTFSIIGDFFILNLLFVIGFYFQDYTGQWLAPVYVTFYAYLNFTWFILIIVFGANKIDRNTTRKSIFFVYIRIVVFFFFLFLLYFQATPLAYYPRPGIKYLFVVFFLLLIAWKFLLYYAFYLYRKQGYNYRNVIILGFSIATQGLRDYFINNQWHGYRFLGFFSDHRDLKNNVVGSWSDLREFIDQNHIDEIYLALNCVPKEALNEISGIISDYPIQVRILPDMGSFYFKSAELINYGSVPVLQVHPGPLSYWYNRMIKRVLDVAMALLVIVFVLSWMSIVLFLISRLGSRDGVFFLQRRTGSDNRVYTCIKYRTMRKNDEADLKQAEKDDDRITPVGRFLRKYSLDELPQFLNVLLGEMSVVGPRPHMVRHTEEYRRLIKRFMLRHTIKPGITGLAQINGFRGEIRQLSDMEHRVENDVYYIENWSVNLDVRIIFLTFWVIIKGQQQAY